MSAEVGISGIKKLKGSSDYPNWKFLVRNYLENKNWWGVISTDVANADVDQQARTTICLLLEPECFTHVYNAKTAKEAWNSLQKGYEDKGWGRRIHIQRELFNCKLENFDSMESYIAKTTFLTQQLSDIDADIPDDWIISILLGGLTAEYSPLIMAVDNSGQQITLEQIKTKLLQEGSRQSKLNTEYEQALVTRKVQNDARSNTKTNDRKQKFVYKCFKCHKLGHKASECKERIKTANICLNTKKVIHKDKWYLDSGCSNHMTHDKNKLLSYKPEKGNMKIAVANGEKLLVKGRGNAEPRVSENEKLILENVLHVPDLSMNLISVSDLTKKNYCMNFDNGGCIIQNKNRIIARCQEVDGIYELTENKNNVVNVTLSKQNENISNIWHKRLAHLSRNYMNKMKVLVTGMEFKSTDLCEPCIPCIERKTCKSPFRNQGTRANEVLQLVFSDVCGPIEEPSFGGSSESGHVCVRLARREGAVLELQLGASLHDAPHHACADQLYTPHVTLITTSLYPVRCPMLGRYTVLDSLADRRRRRQQLTIDESTGEEVAEKPVECVMGQYDSASIGCGASQDTIEFQSACTSTVYTCYGSWREGSLGLVVAGPARPTSRPHALCFIYTTYVRNDSGVPVQYLAVSAVSRACDRSVLPGVAGDKAYNLTINGTCEQSSKYNSVAVRVCPALGLLGALLLLGGR